MLPSVIGFCGPLQSGKTSASHIVISHHPGYSAVSFAQPMRNMLHALGVSYEDMQLRKGVALPALCGNTPRYALQTLGTQWGRDLIGEDIWVNAARHLICQHLDNGHRVVLDDVRFDNEAQMIRELGGGVVRIARPGYEYDPRHASEAGVSESLVGHRIDASDLTELQTRVLQWMNGESQ